MTAAVQADNPGNKIHQNQGVPSSYAKSITAIAIAIIVGALALVGAYYGGLNTLGMAILPGSLFVISLVTGLVLANKKPTNPPTPRVIQAQNQGQGVVPPAGAGAANAPQPIPVPAAVVVPPANPLPGPPANAQPLPAPLPLPRLAPAPDAAQPRPVVAAAAAAAAPAAPRVVQPMPAAAAAEPDPLVDVRVVVRVRSNRVGFPNPHNNNCHYNSNAIVLAHTNWRGLDEIPDVTDAITRELEQKRRELQEIESEIQRNKEKFDQESQEIEERIARRRELFQSRKMDLEKEEQLFREALQRSYYPAAIDQAYPQWKKNYQESRIPGVVNYKEFCTFLNAELHNDALLKSYIDRKEKLESAYREKQSPLSNKKEGLSNDFYWNKGEIQKLEDRLEEMKKLRRAKEVMRILRGETTGSLNAQDARTVYHFYQVNERYDVLTGEDLRKQIFEKPWKVIRVGGHLHWWTYVRNQDGSNTADEINDSYYNGHRHTLTFDDIYRLWKDEAAWKDQLDPITKKTTAYGSQLKFFNTYAD